MKAVYLREQYGYTFDEIMKCLSLDSKEKCTDILTRLKRFNIIKKVKITSLKNKTDLSDIDDDLAENVEIDPNQNGILYKIKFVGVVILKSHILFCYPKYFNNIEFFVSNQSQKFEFKQIIKVIEKYNKNNREQEIFSYNEIDESTTSNKLPVSLFLIEDYFQNGLYLNQQSIVEINGEGEILWDKTVNECFAYFSNDRPIYLDYFNRRSIVDDENFLKRLHEVVLTTISNELEDNGMLELLDLTSVNFTDDVLSDLGDLDYLLYRIESELNREFNTRKQSLLKALYVYVSQNYDFDKDKYASIFGTNSFHVIWEKVCSMVLNDKLEVTIGELKLTPTGENSTSTLLKDMIDKPIWSNKDRRISASKTLVPDTITVFKNKLLILDGKYYNLRFDPLSGNPGVGDVTKQFLYALAYKEFAEKNNLVIENYFLMPTEMETDLGFAYVEMNLLDNLGLSPVKVAKLTASKMYQKYLDHEVDKDLLSKF